MILSENNVFLIQNENLSYMFRVTEHGNLEHLHFGAPVQLGDADAFSVKYGTGWGSNSGPEGEEFPMYLPLRGFLLNIRISPVVIHPHPHVEGFAAFRATGGVLATDALQPESDAALGAFFEDILFIADVFRLFFKDRDDFVPDP